MYKLQSRNLVLHLFCIDKKVFLKSTLRPDWRTSVARFCRGVSQPLSTNGNFGTWVKTEFVEENDGILSLLLEILASNRGF